MMQPDSIPRSTRLRRLAAFARYVTIGLVLAMFIGTHLPPMQNPRLAGADKILHYWAYFSLAMFLLVSAELTLGRLQPIHFFTVWFVCTVYGSLDEITQIPVGRNCDIADLMYDVLGIITALTVFRLAQPLIDRLVMPAPVSSRLHP